MRRKRSGRTCCRKRWRNSSAGSTSVLNRSPSRRSRYSAHCINLPGVISQGETKQEAIDNIADAFRETVLHYRDVKETIPWGLAKIDRTSGAIEVAIVVRI